MKLLAAWREPEPGLLIGTDGDRRESDDVGFRVVLVLPAP